VDEVADERTSLDGLAGHIEDQAGWTKGPDGIRAKNGKQLAIDVHFGTATSPLDEPTAELVSQERGGKVLLRDVDFAPLAFRRTTFYLAHATATFVAFQYPIPTSTRVFP
jgi:hypothetical protein